MKGKIIFSTAREYISKAKKLAVKNSPTILMIAGSVGVVAGVVLAIKAGMDTEKKLEEPKKDLEKVHSKKEKAGDEPIEETLESGEVITYYYKKEDYYKDLTRAYINIGRAYAKLYAPAIATTALSLLMIFKGHSILNKRYTSAAIGFATMSNAYDQYRRNVIENEGEEADEKYRFGIKAVDEEIPVFDKDGNPKLDKNGKQKTIKNTKYVSTNTKFDFRTILFDPSTSIFYSDPICSTKEEEFAKIEHNISVINNAQQTANNRMRARAKNPRSGGIGFFYYDEMAELLGITLPDKIKLVAHDIIWRYDPRLDPNEPDYYDPNFKRPDDWGDNCVNFGLRDPNVPGYKDRLKFMNGLEDGILIYMNYAGVTHSLYNLT